MRLKLASHLKPTLLERQIFTLLDFYIRNLLLSSLEHVSHRKTIGYLGYLDCPLLDPFLQKIINGLSVNKHSMQTKTLEDSSALN